jgi:hypothetical protein
MIGRQNRLAPGRRAQCVFIRNFRMDTQADDEKRSKAKLACLLGGAEDQLQADVSLSHKGVCT